MKKKKISVFTISLILIIIIASLFVIKYFIYNKNSNDIENISLNDIENIEIVVGGGYPPVTYRYKISFSNNSILHKRDDDDNSETFYTEFTNEDSEFFIKQANLYGFFQWNELYETPNVEDGIRVGIYTTFKDGSVQETHCYEAFPPNYDKMAEVFHEAFGYYML
ncbi:MAG: hypothetical protein NC244_13695 [Alistipes senegalensis]|nr:hypothetical protein [Alistipes senegalensis]